MIAERLMKTSIVNVPPEDDFLGAQKNMMT